MEECEAYLLELNLLLKSMEVLHRTYSAPAISALQVSTGTQITLAKIQNIVLFLSLLKLCAVISDENTFANFVGVRGKWLMF